MERQDDWCVKDVMHTIIQRNKQLAKNHVSNIIMEVPVNEETVKQGLIDLAHFMEKHGDKYMPIFERLHSDLIAIQKRNELRDFANYKGSFWVGFAPILKLK
ncbi:hypothetical protein EYS14_22735 [Alteromonadaceae bacterium M269]|nr:hypothetical protein EYS14_22735 [Alteromonadaceae bacterium M269]